MISLQINTKSREAMIDITPLLEDALQAQGVSSGLLLVYAPHTTTGLTINEGADPDVCRDILAHLRTMIPNHAEFRHSEGNSDAHIKSMITGCAVTVPFSQGAPALGTWQGIFLMEFDGPRERKVFITIIE